MGIDLETVPRASARAYSAEKRGVLTQAARPTIEAQWARYQSLLARQYDAFTLPSEIQSRFEDAAIAALQQHLPESVSREIAADNEAWKSASRLKHSALAEYAALELNVRRMASRVVPIIGAPDANNPQTEYLAALSDELRAPIDRTYRQATLEERRALEALARLEAEIALGGKHFHPRTSIARPLSSEDSLDRSTRLHFTTQPQSAPQRQADEVLTLTDELAADSAEALALQCACASASLDLALNADANRQKWIAQVADQAIDEEPAETIRGERAQSAVQIESTRVGATIPVVLTPHKGKPDDGRNQPDAAEQFRRNESGIAGNQRATPLADRDDAQDAFFPPERDSGTTRTTEEGSIGATTQRDLGVTPRDFDNPQSPFQPDCGPSYRHSEKGEYRNLRDVSTIGGSRRAVTARPDEQATCEEAHLGLQNGSQIPTGFGDHGLQSPSASAGSADASSGSANQPKTAADELRDAELTRIRQRRDRLRGSVDVGLRFGSIAAEIVGRYNQRYFQSALSALRHNTFANASDILGYLTPIDERNLGHRKWIGAWMRELSDFRIQDKVRPEPPPIHISIDSIIARRRRKARLPPPSHRPPSSSVKSKDETTGTIPATARHRFTRPPPEAEVTATARPAPPVTLPATALHAFPRPDAAIGSTTSAATARDPAETLAGAQPAPESRPAHVAQTGLDGVAPVEAATVEATTATGSSAAAKSDSENAAPTTIEGPIVDVGDRRPNSGSFKGSLPVGSGSRTLLDSPRRRRIDRPPPIDIPGRAPVFSQQQGA